MTNQLGVGKEILSFCSRCKLTLGHIITVMKDEKTPLKVQCKTCNSHHNHKDPVTKKPVKKKMFSKDSKKAVSWEDKMAMSRNSGNDIKYSIKAEFHVGDVISHPSFGIGFVDSIVDNNKISVIFQSENKTLIHNKK